jgi:hypothetical protein
MERNSDDSQANAKGQCFGPLASEKTNFNEFIFEDYQFPEQNEHTE